jgi:hypothetical protein
VASIPRGQHKGGDITHTQVPIPFETDEGNNDEELDMVKQIKNMSKESIMLKSMKAR